MKNPLISIVMPLYNGYLFLDEAVESVLNQTYENWELLIVDDGSKDESFERALYWQMQDRRIKAYQHENGANKGVSAARNLAIEKSKGEYIALLDCDDKWVKDKLETQLNFIQRNPEVVMTYAKAQVIDENGKKVLESEELERMGRPSVFGNGGGKEFIDFEDVLFKIWVPASTAFMKKNIVEACGNFDETLNVQVEDILLFTQLAEKGKIHFMDQILLYYRIHSSQWNNKLDKKKRFYGKLLYLLHLSPKVNNKNNKLLSSTIIWELYEEIVKFSITYSRFDIKFILESFKRIWNCNSISNYYIYNAFIIVLSRIVKLPLLFLSSSLKNKFNFL